MTAQSEYCSTASSETSLRRETLALPVPLTQQAPKQLEQEQAQEQSQQIVRACSRDSLPPRLVVHPQLARCARLSTAVAVRSGQLLARQPLLLLLLQQVEEPVRMVRHPALALEQLAQLGANQACDHTKHREYSAKTAHMDWSHKAINALDSIQLTCGAVVRADRLRSASAPSVADSRAVDHLLLALAARKVAHAVQRLLALLRELTQQLLERRKQTAARAWLPRAMALCWLMAQMF